MSGSSFTNIFGGNAIKPSDPSFVALTISVNTTLYWPLETAEGVPTVAALMDVTASAGSLKLIMPPANQGSTGVVAIIANVGSNTFTVTDNGGNTIASIATTQAWVIALTNNASVNGSWVAYQLASTTSSATAASLAGYGLSTEAADPTKLQVNWTRDPLSAGVTLSTADRGKNVVWTGAVGTIQLDATATLGAGWFVAVTNEGTGALTITTTGGETINGGATIVMEPGNSGFVIAGSGTFDTYGALLGALSILNGGTGATTAGGALTNLGGTSIGVGIFTAPNAASVISLLGLQNYTFTESTVNSNQVLAANSSGTAFVCTAGLSITIPLTTTLTKTWCVAVYAFAGNVVLTPQVSDAINGNAAGATLTIPQGASCMIVTDAAGNLYTFFLNASGSTGSWAIATGTSDVIAATYNPAVAALTNGLLLGFRAIHANTTSTPTFSPNGLTAHPITDDGGQPLVAGAIAVNSECLVRYNSSLSQWELLNPIVPVALGTNMLVYQTAGTYTFTYPPGVTTAWVDVTGGGGGGGGSTSSSGSQSSVGSGGNGGARGAGWCVHPSGTAITITVGAGGIAGTAGGGNGQAGGTSSFGTDIVAPGGHGGVGGPAATPPFIVGTPTVSNIATTTLSAAILDAEVSSQPGMAPNIANTLGGAGGGVGGATGAIGNNVGNNGVSPGGGGSGASTQASGTQQAGGTGAVGRVIVKW